MRVRLTVRGASVSDLRTKLRDLEGMLATAERRQSSGYGTTVALRCQLSNTDSEDIEYRVMWGELEVPPSALNEPVLSSSFAAPGAVLHLVCEPFGRLSSVSITPETLENEQDSTLVNYMDIQNITGTKSALMQLKIHDPNNGGGNAFSDDHCVPVPPAATESDCERADLNGDGLVDPLDSGFVLARFGCLGGG